MRKAAQPKRAAPAGMFDGLTADIVAMTVAAGLVTGIIDFLSADVAPAGTLILLFTFLLGLRLPRLAWLWAVIIGGAIPLVWAAGLAAGMTPADAFGDPAIACAAVGPAIVGAYFGALWRHVSDHVADARMKKSKR